jgi:cyclase
MLAKRIIPCLDVKDGRVVKGRSFVNLRDAGDPVACGRQYSEAGADELVFLDITATLQARQTIRELAAAVGREVFIPYAIGGGISELDDIKALLQAGAEKISINTAAVRKKHLIREGSEAFGNQAIVVAVDAKRTGNRQPATGNKESAIGNRQSAIGGGEAGGVGTPSRFPVPGSRLPTRWEVYVSAGTTPTGIDVIEWVQEVAALGAGEILLTSIDADGHKAGYDMELTRAVAEAVNIPVIASGGAGGPEDILRVLTEGKADAALAASIFHYGQYTIAQVKDFLAAHGVVVRR